MIGERENGGENINGKREGRDAAWHWSACPLDLRTDQIPLRVLFLEFFTFLWNQIVFLRNLISRVRKDSETSCPVLYIVF